MKRDANVTNVVSLRDRLESWKSVYVSRCNRLQIYTSNHGRMKVWLDSDFVFIDFVEGVRLLAQVSDGIENVVNELRG